MTGDRRVRLAVVVGAIAALGGLLAASTGLVTLPAGPSAEARAESPRPPSAGSTASPTPDPIVPCQPLRIDPGVEMPRVGLAPAQGELLAYGGLTGASQLGSREFGTPGGWRDVLEESRVPLLSDSGGLLVIVNDDTCIQHAVADAAAVASDPRTTLLLASRAPRAGSRTSRVLLPQPPEGEWIVRTRLDFFTTGDGPAWVETFFRVHVRAGGPATPQPPGLPILDLPAGGVELDQQSADWPAPGSAGTGAHHLLGDVATADEYEVTVVCNGSDWIRYAIGREGTDAYAVGRGVPCDRVPRRHLIGPISTPDASRLPVLIDVTAGTEWHIVIAIEP